MKKDFSLSNDKAMINFTVKYCDTHEKLLESEGFKRVLTSYVEKIKRKNTHIYKFIANSLSCTDADQLTDEFVRLFKLMIVMKSKDIVSLNSKYSELLHSKESFIDLVEDLYLYWRKLEKYTIVANHQVTEGYESVGFVDANNSFSTLVISLYRKIS